MCRETDSSTRNCVYGESPGSDLRQLGFWKLEASPVPHCQSFDSAATCEKCLSASNNAQRPFSPTSQQELCAEREESVIRLWVPYFKVAAVT